MTNGPHTSLGKEVLHDGRHLADAVSTTAAADDIACAMNILWDIRQGERSDQDDERQPGLFFDHETAHEPTFPNDGDAHDIRQETDEYACSCGKRWDVSEGREHP